MTFDVDNDLKASSASQLKQEKQSVASQLLHVQQQISDLAFSNYRTYADAGSTTEHCRKRFGEASELVDSIDEEINGLRHSLKDFRTNAAQIDQDITCLKLAESRESPLWDILSLPTRMDVCIRAGYYEDAYLLTNYGIQLQQHGLTKNHLIKIISDRLVQARHHLLSELFNQFAGPIDLATSIQVVNNIRKIPCLSPTQLRVSILQYRDLFLEKQIMNIRSQPDFILRMVEVYRDCMYDTMVMHLAVFPENEAFKRDPSVDPRWDVWQPAGPSAVLSEWAIHNLENMFNFIRECDDSLLDVESLSSKLMSFASSFGRMGLDFRPMVASIIQDLVAKRFSNSVVTAALRLVSLLSEHEDIGINGDIPDELSSSHPLSLDHPASSTALMFWDDLCVYGNAIIEAMNQLRNGLTPLMINPVLDALKKSLKMVFKWLDTFVDNTDQREKLAKGIKLIVGHLMPYLHFCLLTLFPYQKCCRQFYSTSISQEDYEKRCDILLSEVCEDCVHADFFKENIEQIEKKRGRVGELRPRFNDVDESVSKTDSAVDNELKEHVGADETKLNDHGFLPAGDTGEDSTIKQDESEWTLDNSIADDALAFTVKKQSEKEPQELL